MASRLALTSGVDMHCRNLKANGCVVDRDKDAGTVVVKDGDTVVFQAIQKGHKQPWIVTFTNSERIQWKWSDT